MGSYLDSKKSFEETALLLPQNQQENLRLFLEITKTKPKWYATNNFKYSYNGISVYRLNFTEKDTWRINLTVEKAGNIDEVLLLLSKPFQDFFFTNLRRCKQCNPAHGNGKRIIILDNEYFVCAEPEIQICNPTVSDIEMLYEVINLRKNNIKLIKK
ncbi:MAG: hypothetical protein A2Y17_11260 [Clostridiales bacterium GWF2_38_85]|nr:MAG: hypothetical protein A2Y17_11260 [Clostridiales bacterium GWF2_38_85]HBL84703.1 hypothetical protein [Clostridiales bacterium]